jgi:hypothetical protein
LAGKKQQSLTVEFETEKQENSSNEEQDKARNDDSGDEQAQSGSDQDSEEEEEEVIVTAKKVKKVVSRGRQRSASDPTAERVENNAPQVMNALKTRGGGNYQVPKPVVKKVAVAHAHMATAVVLGNIEGHESGSDDDEHWADEKATGGGNVWLYDNMFFD